MSYLYYVFSVKYGPFAAEAEYAKKLRKYIFYDEQKDCFFDADGNQFDITGMDLFPRTGILQADKLIKEIYNHGGYSSVAKLGDYEKVLDWSRYIKTKRNNVIMSGKELLDDVQRIVDEFGIEQVFFKTKFKNYSQILDVEKLLKREESFYETLKAHKDDDFILSDVVNIAEDDNGPLEYRCYIINGKLANVSRIHDYLVGYVSQEVIDKAIAILESVKETDFPNSFVLDLFEYIGKDGEKYLDVLECNPLVSSGTYLYNTVFDTVGNLNHNVDGGTAFDAIPQEKIMYGPVDKYLENTSYDGCPSILYELSGGFAADLLSYTMFGSSSKGMFFHLDKRIDIDPSNIDFSGVKAVESEDTKNSNDENKAQNDIKILELLMKGKIVKSDDDI